MQDKLESTSGEVSDTLTRVETLLVYLQQDINTLKSLKKDDSEDLELNLKGIKWHCLSCGHTWEGYVKLNPEVPKACAKCKSPYWGDIPKDRKQLHENKYNEGKPCPLCAKIINREIELLEQLKALAKEPA